MRFWCSVSDRCSGKIGEGEVPLAQFQLCLLSLFGTKGSCHICHDWCGCRKIVRAYLHETPEGEPTPADPFCVAIICPAHSSVKRSSSTHAATQPQSVYISGNDSSCYTDPLVITPKRIPRYHVSWAHRFSSGKDRTAQNISTRHLPLRVCVIFISFWNANDKWCSEEKPFHHIWQWRVFFFKGNSSTLGWSFWRSHPQLCSILRASEDPSEFELIWRTMK